MDEVINASIERRTAWRAPYTVGAVEYARRQGALTILRDEVTAHPDRMKRFVQEAKAASALNHPNIITIYEIEQIDAVNFIAIEFIDGETLREHMRKVSVKLGEVLDIAIQTASAL